MKMIGLPGAHERRVELGHHAARVVAVHAEHDAVGLHEVVDRRAFLQELRVAAHVERDARVLARPPPRPSPPFRPARWTWSRRPSRASCACRSCSATASTWRRSAEPSSSGGVPTAMKTTSAVDDGRGDVGRELQAALPLIALDDRVEARLVDRQDVLLQPVDLCLVDVGADDLVAGLGEAGAHDQADVARANDRNVHACSDSLKLRGRNSLPWRRATRRSGPARSLTEDDQGVRAVPRNPWARVCRRRGGGEVKGRCPRECRPT